MTDVETKVVETRVETPAKPPPYTEKVVRTADGRKIVTRTYRLVNEKGDDINETVTETHEYHWYDLGILGFSLGAIIGFLTFAAAVSALVVAVLAYTGQGKSTKSSLHTNLDNVDWNNVSNNVWDHIADDIRQHLPPPCPPGPFGGAGFPGAFGLGGVGGCGGGCGGSCGGGCGGKFRHGRNDIMYFFDVVPICLKHCTRGMKIKEPRLNGWWDPDRYGELVFTGKIEYDNDVDTDIHCGKFDFRLPECFEQNGIAIDCDRTFTGVAAPILRRHRSSDSCGSSSSGSSSSSSS